jgi:hypothetical protein
MASQIWYILNLNLDLASRMSILYVLPSRRVFLAEVCLFLDKTSRWLIYFSILCNPFFLYYFINKHLSGLWILGSLVGKCNWCVVLPLYFISFAFLLDLCFLSLIFIVSWYFLTLCRSTRNLLCLAWITSFAWPIVII